MKKKGYRMVVGVTVGAFLVFMSATNSFAGDKSEGYKLIKANGCLACHAIDQNKVGPAYKIVAQRNKKLYGKDALKEIESAINKGSKGRYKDLGITAVMPPFSFLGKEKIDTIAKWILHQDK